MTTPSPRMTTSGRSLVPRRPWAPYARVVLALSALGAAAVAVQVIAWLDAVAVLFRSGSRAAAAAGALAAALVGPAAGALAARRPVDRAPDRLRFLAGLYLALGACTVATPWILRLPVNVFVSLWREGRMPGLLGFLGIVLAAVGLLPGMALVGALVPATMRVTTGTWSRLGRLIGYTAASMLAGLAAGTFLLGLGAWEATGLGVTGRLWGAAVIHLALGATLAVLSGLAARGEAGPSTTEGAVPRLRRRDRLSPQLRRVALVGAAAAGLAAGGYRLLLAPLLAAQLADRPTSLAMAAGVALAGAAVGAWVGGRLIDYRRDRTIWVAGALTVAGWAALWTAAAMPGIARAVPALTFGVRSRPLGEALTFLATIVPVAFCLGAAWPALCRVFVDNLAHVGAHTGVMAAAWCGGGLAAAAAAGWVEALPIGCQAALVPCALVLSAVGVALVLVDFGLERRARTVCVAVIVATTGAAALVQPGEVRYGAEAAQGHGMVFYSEATGGVVAVAQSQRPERWLIVNGREADGTGVEWSAPAFAMAHVPVLLHRSPQRVLVLGHRAGAAVSHAGRFAETTRIEVVEPLDGVLHGAGRFRHAFGAVAAPTAVVYRRTDPRGFVLGTDSYYDLIAANAPDPGSAPGAGMYSREHLAACADHLRGEGLLALRVPLEHLGLDDLRLVVRTFRSAFGGLGHVQLWWVPVQRREVMLLGSRQWIRVDLDRVAERLRGHPIPTALRLAGGGDPEGLASWLTVAGPALDEFAGQGPVESDSAPALCGRVSRRAWLRTGREEGLPDILSALAAARSASRDYRLHALAAEGWSGDEAGDRSRQQLEEAFERFDRSWAEIVAGHLAELAGDQQAATKHYAAALALNPDDRAAHYLLAGVAGRERAAELVRELSRRPPDTAAARRPAASRPSAPAP